MHKQKKEKQKKRGGYLTKKNAFSKISFRASTDLKLLCEVLNWCGVSYLFLLKNKMDASDGIPWNTPSPRDPFPRFLLVVAYLRRDKSYYPRIKMERYLTPHIKCYPFSFPKYKPVKFEEMRNKFHKKSKRINLSSLL